VSKSALITGSTGFVGKRLVNFLNMKNYHVRTISRNTTLYRDNIVCDLVNDKFPESIMESIDVVFHLAGFAHDMRDANKIADLYYKVNVSATVQLANLAVKFGVKRFVFVSSVKAGGSPPFGICANEEDQSNTEDIYGKTKREAELALLKIGKESGMYVSIIRPSLVYGPDVRGNLQLMLSGIGKRWFPPLPETGNQRSMIHVDDLVRAILLVAKDKRANGEIFIATDGTPYSSREIYNTMCGVTGKLIPKWSVPKILFNLASLASPRIKYKINKLLGDECYSSVKLEELGFKAKKSLKDMNETDF
jgi:UDP-glucose 4-epimerase